VENTGKRKLIQTRALTALAEIIATEIIPSNKTPIMLGITGLCDIHGNTNELVMHKGEKLNAVLLEKDTIRTYALALIVEVSEFLQTLDWKPWKNGKQESDERVLDEFADILAFVGVLITQLNAMGYSCEAITNAYLRKEHENVRRFIQKIEEDSSQHE
jgi:hypothetical protein